MADIRASIEVDNRQALSALNQVQTGVSNLGNRFAALQGIVAGIGFGALIQQANQFAQVVQNVSGATGVSTDTVQRFANAVRSIGGDAQNAAAEIIDFTSGLDAAKRGGDAAQKSLAEVGITVGDLARLSNEELFTKALKNVQSIEDATLRNKKAVELFGKAFKDLDIRGVNLGAAPTANQSAVQAAAAAQQNLASNFANFQAALLNALEPINTAFSKINIAVADWERNIKLAFAGVTAIIGGFIALKLGSKLADSVTGSILAIKTVLETYEQKVKTSYSKLQDVVSKFNKFKEKIEEFRQNRPTMAAADKKTKLEELRKERQEITDLLQKQKRKYELLKKAKEAAIKRENELMPRGMRRAASDVLDNVTNSVNEFTKNISRGGRSSVFAIGGLVAGFGKLIGVVGIISGVVAALDLLFAALGRRGPTKVFMDNMEDIAYSADLARQRIEKLRLEQEKLRETMAGTLDEPAAQATPITPFGRAARVKQDREDALRNAEAIKEEMLATAKAVADAADMKKIIDAEALARFEFRKPFLDALGAAERLNLEITQTQELQARLATADSITVAVEQRRLQLTQQRNAVLADIDGKVKDIESRIAQGFIIDEVDLRKANRELEDLKQLAETVRAVFGSIIRESTAATREALTAQQAAVLVRDTKLFGSELRRNLDVTREGFELQNGQRMLLAKMLPLHEEERRLNQAVLDIQVQRETELARVRTEIRRLNEEAAAGVDDPGRADRIKELLASQERIKQIYDEQAVAITRIVAEEIRSELLVKNREDALQRSIDLIERQYEQYRSINEIVNKTTADIREQVAQERLRGQRMRPDPRLTIDVESLEIAERNTREMRQAILDLYNTIEERPTDDIVPATVAAQMDRLGNAARDITGAYMELNRVQQDNLAYSRTWEAGWKDAFDRYTDGVRYAANISRDVFNSTFGAIENALDILTSRGRAKFKEFGKAIVKDVMSDLLRISFRRMVLAMGFGGFGNSILNPASMFAGPGGIPFAGAYAEGGYIPPGKVGLVGEQGPEFISGPAQITPMDQIGMAGPSVVNNININAIDSRSVAEFFAQNRMLLLGTVRGAEKTLPTRSRV